MIMIKHVTSCTAWD